MTPSPPFNPGRLHHRRPSLPAEGSAAFGVVPWEVVLRSMPWNVLFLVGGGLALSMAYKESNLSRAIASAFAVGGWVGGWLVVERYVWRGWIKAADDAASFAVVKLTILFDLVSIMQGLATVPFPMIAGSVCLVTILISNFISNVATANIILPPLGCIAVHLHR
jgi:di/tricarboxylate transporter